jgi:hypothetical protein
MRWFLSAFLLLLDGCLFRSPPELRTVDVEFDCISASAYLDDGTLSDADCQDICTCFSGVGDPKASDCAQVSTCDTAAGAVNGPSPTAVQVRCPGMLDPPAYQ